MVAITLPDSSRKEFDGAVTVAEVAASISPRLAKAAVAGELDGERLVDTNHLIDADSQLTIITAVQPLGLEVIRHSTAHLLAQAVKQLFPSAQVTIGPVIEDGFYYDFSFERPFTPDDLEAIEERMAELAKQGLSVVREETSRDEAIAIFRALGEHYKVEIIESIDSDQTLSLYRQGDFVDLCRGPHVPSTSQLKAFKLMKVAGAYWRGDANNEMLQRIYGTAWADKKALKAYLQRLEEAKKRDHRLLAKQMDLFHFQGEAPGMVFWHDAGWRIFQIIEQYMRDKLRQNGYLEVKTPQMVDRVLWEKSGHWENYQQEMFITESEKRTFAVKPMSCPCHVQIFNQGVKSYRDLPLRMAEFGCCHRNEPSGTLHGLMRARNFVQDDAHIFCTEEQIQAEATAFVRLLHEVYSDFGFDEVEIAISTRPDKRIGDDALWDRAEAALKQALESLQIGWSIKEGDGAFYGPKIDFSFKDCLGRIWQLGTLQLDYALPARLGAEYVAEDGGRYAPVILHRAIFGSFERFIGVLLEHYTGKLPLWLAPIQIVLLNISEHQNVYAQQLLTQLQDVGLRAAVDLRNEKIGFKIRELTLKRIPYLAVVGDREMEAGTVSLRTQAGEDLGSMSMEKLLARLHDEIRQRSGANKESK
ncbi:MAG: threonine--tRNA ligase [Gammaproteobacteria bacterium]|nr:threonine--tRNA ligase [Gammaproteobacteria bacterium]